MRAPQLPPVPLSHLTGKPDASKRFRLLEQVRRALRVRHYSPRTQISYCGWVRRFVLFNDRRHPASMGEQEIAAFLNHLATDGRVSAATQNQALHALLFLYRHLLDRDIGLIPGITPAKRGRDYPLSFLLARYVRFSCGCAEFRGFAPVSCMGAACVCRSARSFV